MGSTDSQLITVVADLSAQLVHQTDAVDASYVATQGCVEVLAADLAAVLIADQRQRLRVLASSREDNNALDILEAQKMHPATINLLRGTDESVHFTLTAASEPTEFFTLAERQGFGFAIAVPLNLRHLRVGVLSVLWHGTRTLNDDDVLTLTTFANLTSAALLSEHLHTDEKLLSGLLERTFQDRIAIEQAKGMVAQATNSSIEQGFELLKVYSRRTKTPLRTVARLIVSKELAPETMA